MVQNNTVGQRFCDLWGVWEGTFVSPLDVLQLNYPFMMKVKKKCKNRLNYKLCPGPAMGTRKHLDSLCYSGFVWWTGSLFVNINNVPAAQIFQDIVLADYRCYLCKCLQIFYYSQRVKWLQNRNNSKYRTSDGDAWLCRVLLLFQITPWAPWTVSISFLCTAVCFIE